MEAENSQLTERSTETQDEIPSINERLSERAISSVCVCVCKTDTQVNCDLPENYSNTTARN